MTEEKKALTLTKNQIEEVLQKHKIPVRTGDYVIGNSRGEIYKVGDIDSKGIHLLHSYGNDWHDYTIVKFEEWNKERYLNAPPEYLKIEGTLDEAYKNLFNNINELTKEKPVDKDIETSTALIEVDTKKNLKQAKNLMQQRRNNLEIATRLLDRKRSQLQSMVSDMQEKIGKVQRLLGQIELYLGINEDIMQIYQGPKASFKEQIHFRQQIIFMDEEYGAVENQGLDWENIKDFDDWLTTDRHFERVIPEQKCVVILRVRRSDKHYSEDPIANAWANQANHFTYVLIRNGENLYRIWAGIIIKPRLFPQKEELQKMVDDTKSDKLWGFDKKDFEDKIFTYQQNLLLLQGLLDRTDILTPIPVRVNLFKPDKNHEKYIRFIYDDEASLTEGRKYYKEWKEEINGKIKRGTRIYFCGFPYYMREKGCNSRLQHAYQCDQPKSGVYNVSYIKKEKHYYSSSESETLYCHYLPNDSVYLGWDYGSQPRKNKIWFMLHKSDEWVLNYDLIDLDDVEYYINNRYERQHYLDMLPVLYTIKAERIKEIAWEKEFVKAMSEEMNCKEELIWKAVNWWKTKVIWKRPILREEAKAWRMVKSKVRRMIEND